MMNFLLKKVGCFVLTVLFLSLSVPVFSETPEEVIPPCFTGSELAKVREWEKTWVGKKVGLADLDQVKDLIPEFLYKQMKEPAKWGAKELWFEVVPYRYCTPSKGVVEATAKYSPTSKFEPKGIKTPWGEVAPNEFLSGYLKGEIAGYPFPKAKSGIEMAWNYDANTSGDNYARDIWGPVVNCKTGAERRAWQPQKRMYWTGRMDLPPIPRIEPNPKGYRRTFLQVLIEPHDMYGTQFLELRYTDPAKEDDTFIWIAMYRRIRRLSSSQRDDTIDGSDHSYCDEEGFSGQINRNTYKYVGVKDVLACRHMDSSKYTREKGQGLWSGIQRERCKVYLVEMTPKDKTSIYSKVIWYLDGETWQMPYKESWDRQGRLWRVLDEQMGYFTSVKGYPVIDVVGYTYADVQRYHAGPNWHKNPKYGEDYDPEIFTIQSLQKGY
ncbi:MAG TPA: DUF1329 domain-containing protein [Thermodesulfobacteriota bacterium]|nr:DUF1329 domain-containing protein [Thermodesulfobacteriota bacterium]